MQDKDWNISVDLSGKSTTEIGGVFPEINVGGDVKDKVQVMVLRFCTEKLGGIEGV